MTPEETKAEEDEWMKEERKRVYVKEPVEEEGFRAPTKAER